MSPSPTGERRIDRGAGRSAPFVHRTRIRFHQADPAGVLFFGRITELIQAAYEDLVDAMGLDRRAHFAQTDSSTPIARLEVDYHRPIFSGEDVTVSVVVERIGRRSFTMRYEVRGASDELRVTARTVMVYATPDESGFTPAPLPDELRMALGGYHVPSGQASGTETREP